MARLPIVLVAGTLCDERLFEPMLAHLEVEAVVAPPVEQGDVREASRVILATAPRRFVAVGFSLGAVVVLEMLRQAPAQIAGAALISGNAHPTPPEFAEARRAEVETLRTGGAAILIDQLWPRYVARAASAREDLRALIVAMAEAVGVERFAQQAELVISRPDSLPTVRDVQVPLLVLHGEEDGMVPADRYQAAAVSLRAKRIQLDGVGHFAPLEAPERTAQALGAWLREVPA